MKLMPFNDDRRVSMKLIIAAVIYGLITFFAAFTATHEDIPRDIPIEVKEAR